MASDRTKEIFFDALEVPPDRRPLFLDAACDADPDLRGRVEALLRAHDGAGDFLGAPTSGGARAVRDAVGREIPPGTLIDRYRIVRSLGEGGFGEVLLARQERPVVREVALKVVRAGMDSRAVVQRFEAERQTLAILDHPGVARVFDAGTTPSGRPYFVMEHVSGEPITRFCDLRGMGVRDRLTLFVDVCRAVQHAHQRGVIHRDLKPSNVLVTLVDDKPAPKVIDFGVAKAIRPIEGVSAGITQERQIVGTPGYMSPEQASFDHAAIDTRTDVYSLGAMLYELLVGAPPFDERRLANASPGELERIIREDEPRRPSTREISEEEAEARGSASWELKRALRSDLDWIVLKALEKDRSRRYQSAGALADDIVRMLEHREVSAAPPTLRYQVGKFIRRHRTAAGAAALLSITLIGATAVSVGFGLWAVRERAHAVDAERLAARRADEVAHQAAIAEAVNAFLTTDLLGAVDPSELGRDVTMREALDAASARLEEGVSPRGAFEQTPEVETAVRHSIGSTYTALGEYDRALPHLERAVEVNRSIHGAGSDQWLESTNALVNLLFRRGESERALPIAEEALATSERVAGTDDPRTLEARTMLATVLVGLGRFERAERLLRQTIEGWARTSPRDETRSLSALNNLASLLDDQGRHAEAGKLMERVVRIRRAALGPTHPLTLTSINNLALALKREGRLDEAQPLYREALAGRRAALGETHPETLGSMNNLAVLYLDQEQPEPAAELLEDLLATQKQAIGPTHWQTLSTLINLARARRMMGDFERAERLCAEAIAGAGDGLPPGHWITGVFHAHRATALEGLDRLDEAESERLEAHRILLEALGPDHPRTRAQVESIAQLLERRGRRDDSAAWRARLPETAEGE